MTPIGETWAARWRRRAVTLPVLGLAVTLYVVLAPVLFVLAALVDGLRIVRGRRAAVLRLWLYLGCYLGAEALGVVALLFVWLRFVRRRARMVEATYRVQQVWTRFLLHSAMRLFALRVVVDGDQVAAIGPYVLLVRHTSILDTLLPSVYITQRYGVRLRFVLKRELLLDPCLDIAGNRLPNYFVARDGKDDLDGIVKLVDQLGEHDGVLIYPEGTRMSASKRKRALERIAATQPALVPLAEKLQHTLPPRLGGTLTLIEHTPHDVVVFAHTGLEGFARPSDLWRGGLIGKTVRVKIWRVPRSAIPPDREARIAWLFAEWQRVDDWVGAADPAVDRSRPTP